MHYPHASSVPPPRTTWHWSASMVRRNLPTVALGTSLDVAVGTSVVAVGSGLGLQAGTGGTLSTSGPPGSFTAYIQVPVTNKAGGRVVVAGPDRPGLRCGDCQHGRPLCRLRRPLVLLGGKSTLTNSSKGTLGVTVNARAKTASGIPGAGVTLAGILTVTTLARHRLGTAKDEFLCSPCHCYRIGRGGPGRTGRDTGARRPVRPYRRLSELRGASAAPPACGQKTPAAK
jgi:hypothetical protein